MSDKKRPEKISIEEFRRQFANGDDPDSLNYNTHSYNDAHLDHDAYLDIDLAVSDLRWKQTSEEQLNIFVSLKTGEGVVKNASGEVVGTARGENVFLDLDTVNPSNVNRLIEPSVAYEPKTYPDEAKQRPAKPQGFYGGGEAKDIQSQRVLVRPPGAGLMRLVTSLPGRARLRKDLEQVIADMREEHFDALAAGDERGAQIALWRGRYEVVRAIVPSWAMGIFGAAAKWLVGRFMQG